MSSSHFTTSAATIAAAVIVGSIAVASAASAETTLILNNFFPAKSPFVRALIKPWSAAVEKTSQGRIKVKIPAASMAPPPRQWDMVVKGTADVAITSNSFQRQRLKLPDIASIPFLTPSAEAASASLWRTQRKFFDAANEYKGVKLLAQFTLVGSNIQSRKKPILSAADLKGVKIRTNPGAQKAIMQALGATPFTAAGIKAFELISNGIVDGTLQVVDAALILGYGRHLKSVTEFPGGLTKSVFSFFMNRKTWDGLSAADKAAVEQASGETASRRIGRAFDKFAKFSTGKLKKGGVTFIQADPAFFADARKRLAFMEKGWLAAANSRGVDGPAALAFYQKTANDIAKATAK